MPVAQSKEQGKEAVCALVGAFTANVAYYQSRWQ
jgi:hypothetical protein